MAKKRDYKNLFKSERELIPHDKVEEILPKKEEDESSPQYGRPIKNKAIGRVKFTTVLNKELRNELKHIATDKEISLADLLEEIVREYLKK
jgi:dTDP-4-dehydrorhamnose reductase